MKKRYVAIFMVAALLSVQGCSGQTVGTENPKGQQTVAENAVDTPAESAAEITAPEKQDLQSENAESAASTNAAQSNVTSANAGASNTVAQDTAVENSSEQSVQTDANQKSVAKQYTWQEINVTLPDNWVDKCIIIDVENGFSIYHRASYEKDNAMGFICQFCRSNEYLVYGTGETLLAYSESGEMYYLMQPTDLCCDITDEALFKEYEELRDGINEIKSSVNISKSDVKYDVDEYVIPVSGFYRLSSDVLSEMSAEELRIAKNEIYARHGRMFNDAGLQEHFNKCNWYKGTVKPEEFDDSVLSYVERDNLTLIADEEAACQE